MRWQPAFGLCPPIMTMPAAYCGAGSRRLKAQLATSSILNAGRHRRISFHGMPERTLHLRRSLSLPLPENRASAFRGGGQAADYCQFQSRFGRAKWLEPSTEDTIKQRGARRSKKDCDFRSRLLSRLPRNVRRAGHAGQGAVRGSRRREHYAYLPCLNDSEPGMDMLEALVSAGTFRLAVNSDALTFTETCCPAPTLVMPKS
jgi:ferrochelatase